MKPSDDFDVVSREMAAINWSSLNEKEGVSLGKCIGDYNDACDEFEAHERHESTLLNVCIVSMISVVVTMMSNSMFPLYVGIVVHLFVLGRERIMMWSASERLLNAREHFLNELHNLTIEHPKV